jgi:TetR/AcrR family transcriptional repressor of nem operon
VLNQWRDRFCDCIAQAQAAGEIATRIEPAALAQFFWSAWEGAVLCAKLEESTRALDNVATLFLDQMLQPTKPAAIAAGKAATARRRPSRRSTR